MRLESIQIPAFVATVLTLVTLIVIPALSMTEWRSAQTSFTGTPEAAEGTSCPVPPALDVAGGGGDGSSEGPTLMDRDEGRKFKTATFALG